MARVCQITKKKGLFGHRVSHSNVKTNHVQLPNLQKKKVFVPELGRTVTVRMSTKGLKAINKNGAFKALKKAGLI